MGASASDRCLRGPDPELELRVETRLPSGLPAGCRTAIFVYGSCFHRRHRVKRIEIAAGGASVRAIARMPRADIHRTLHPFESDSGREPDNAPSDDPKAHSYRSGFWATLPIEMPAGGGLAVTLRAILSNGGRVDVPLGEIEAAAPPGPDPDAVAAAEATGARIGIALASYDPDLELFSRQIESIRGQTREDWVCVISDDCSPPEVFARMQEIVEGDERFVLRRALRRAGFYRNFERALEMLPTELDHLALADQDDWWYPEKLATLADAIGDANLVYSDQRIVDPSGDVIAPSYWGERENNYEDLTSLLITNTVTGAASLFRCELLDRALPFPQPPGEQYHDHWLGLVALASGRIAYVDRPLYDYVQHGGAALGHARATSGPPATLGQRLRRLLRGSAGEAALGSRAAYFYALRRLELLAQVLMLRCNDALAEAQRRELERLLRSERSPGAMLWLAARSSTSAAQTGGAEQILLQGIAWRHLQRARSLVRKRPKPGQPLEAPHDASLPALRGPRHPAAGPEHPFVRKLASFIEPLELSISERAPHRVNLLVPTIELKHLFGGYIAKFNLARRLAEHGERIRIVAVDATPHLPVDWRERVESYEGLAGLFERVEVAFARDQDSPLELSPDDVFVATTWWTAHLAHAMVERIGSERFVYLIQEYEPYTHPMGSWAALAMASYSFPHYAVFSTELLRQFFARHGYGVFAAGEEAGRRDSVSFQNAITPVAPPAADELAAREQRRLLFYARPEPHATRNMFELGLMALGVAISRGAFDERWSFQGIGSVEGYEAIRLANGVDMELLARQDQASYASLLAGCDVGLSLMLTPHPSLVPLEMAAAGMATVTNSFENKTAEAMEAISGNLIAAEPSLEGVAAGLERAAAAVDDHEARVRGAKEVEWSRDWNTAFDDGLIEQVAEWLASC